MESLIALEEAVNYSNSTFLEALAIVEMTQRVNIDNNNLTETTKKYIEEKNVYHSMIKDIFNTAYNYLIAQEDVIESVVVPDAGNIMHITIKSDVAKKFGVETSDDLFVYIMEKENILITPANVFGLPLEDISFRVTISRNKNQFMDGLKRIVNLFREECI